MKTSSLVSVLALVLCAGCNVDFVPVPSETDAGPAADAGMTTPPADSGPQGPVCGDGRCDGDRDCAADCRQAPPADAGTTCLAGAVLCSGQCRDLQNNASNCGACGRTCASGQSCNAGVCTTPVVCGGANLQTDVANCGTCSNRCATGQTCSAGRCTTPVPPCPSGRDAYDIVAEPRLQGYCPEGIQIVVMGMSRGQDVTVTSDGRLDTGDPSIDRFYGASGQALSLSTRAGLWSNYMIGVTGYCASTRSWLEASTVNAYRGYTSAAGAGFRIMVRGQNIAATSCPIPATPMVGAATPYPWCTIPSWMVACR